MLLSYSVEVFYTNLRPEIPFLGKYGQKNQSRQFKIKFDTKVNSNVQNVMVTFTVFIFNLNYPFWKNLVQKIKVVSLKIH